MYFCICVSLATANRIYHWWFPLVSPSLSWVNALGRVIRKWSWSVLPSSSQILKKFWKLRTSATRWIKTRLALCIIEYDRSRIAIRLRTGNSFSIRNGERLISKFYVYLQLTDSTLMKKGLNNTDPRFNEDYTSSCVGRFYKNLNVGRCCPAWETHSK